MAISVLPYPDIDFIPLDILTADELNQIVANITTINNATIGTDSIANGSVTGDKVDLASVLDAKYSFATRSITIANSEYVALESVTIDKAGTYFIIAGCQVNVYDTTTYNTWFHITINGTETRSDYSSNFVNLLRHSHTLFEVQQLQSGDVVKAEVQSNRNGVQAYRGRLVAIRIA